MPRIHHWGQADELLSQCGVDGATLHCSILVTKVRGWVTSSPFSQLRGGITEPVTHPQPSPVHHCTPGGPGHVQATPEMSW